MEVRENVERFLKKEGINPESLVLGEQVHGKRVRVVNKNETGKVLKNTDGLITSSREIVLGVLIADCLPVSFVSENICGILHVGWKGLQKGIIKEALLKVEEKERVENLFFEIGPGIEMCHFQVREDFAENFEKDFVGKFLKKKENKLFFDLKKATKKKIEECGGKKIKTSDICTFCSEKYFSYRKGNITERMIALIKL